MPYTEWTMRGKILSHDFGTLLVFTERRFDCDLSYKKASVYRLPEDESGEVLKVRFETETSYLDFTCNNDEEAAFLEADINDALFGDSKLIIVNISNAYNEVLYMEKR